MSYYDIPPVLERIADCESGGTQFNDNGVVVRSATGDYGFFQISYIHRKEALRMGDDIMTTKGNILYGLYLYRTEGTAPWNSSKSCWDESP